MLGREEKETRSALSRLKTHGNRQKVGVTRTGSATLGKGSTGASLSKDLSTLYFFAKASELEKSNDRETIF